MKAADHPCPHPDVAVLDDPADGASMLIKGAGDRRTAVSLNATGRRLWSLCDGVRTCADLLLELEGNHGDIPGERLAADLEAFVDDLVARRFLWLRRSMNVPRRGTGARRPLPLFIMGNKRSGSTLLVRLLNLHPHIFVTDESDIVWILHQARDGEPPRFNCYEWDDAQGMNASLSSCLPIMRTALHETPGEGGVANAFHQVQNHLMKVGLRGQKPRRKGRLAWLGDKKPVQHADPKLRPFMLAHFPKARYIHIVRDPRAVAPSMIALGKSLGGVAPRYWHGSRRELVERWAVHEEWVLRARSSETSPIHTVRLEDLCREPVRKMTDIFNFLDVETPGGVSDPIRELVAPAPNRKYEPLRTPTSTGVKRIMRIHGYC